MAVNIVCLRIHSQVQSEGLIPFICSFMPPLLHFTHKTQDPSQTSQIELHTNTGMFHVNSGRVCCSGCMSPRVLMGMDLDICPHLLPFLLLFSGDMGAWGGAHRGCYSEEVDGWRWRWGGCLMWGLQCFH